MDDARLSGLENFSAVWSRVTGEPVKQPVTQPAKINAAQAELQAFMTEARNGGALYAALAQKMRGTAAGQLRAMSADERRHLRGLELEYFLMTGDTYAPPGQSLSGTGVLQALRRAYAGEENRSRAYADAAERADTPALRQRYLDYSQAAAAHSRTLRILIERSLQ